MLAHRQFFGSNIFARMIHLADFIRRCNLKGRRAKFALELRWITHWRASLA